MEEEEEEGEEEKKKEKEKKDGNKSQEHRSQIKGAPTVKSETVWAPK